MEKDNPSKPKRSNKFLKFLPKAASAVSFQNPPFSPGRDTKKRPSEPSRTKSHVGKGFSGPMMVSIIPNEARTRRSYGGKDDDETPGLGEPTSPKVSCMGQIKKKHHKKKEDAKKSDKKRAPPQPEKKGLRRMFTTGGGTKQGMSKKSNFDAELTREQDEPRLPERAPGLGQMRRFASSRDAFANFDWSTQIAPLDPEQRNDQSDEEGREHYDEDGEILIPFSAPIAIGGGVHGGGGDLSLEPRKEINLWKRRTMVPPRPLQLQPLTNEK